MADDLLPATVDDVLKKLTATNQFGIDVLVDLEKQIEVKLFLTLNFHSKSIVTPPSSSIYKSADLQNLFLIIKIGKLSSSALTLKYYNFNTINAISSNNRNL